jgi:hypothetical protein
VWLAAEWVMYGRPRRPPPGRAYARPVLLTKRTRFGPFGSGQPWAKSRCHCSPCRASVSTNRKNSESCSSLATTPGGRRRMPILLAMRLGVIFLRPHDARHHERCHAVGAFLRCDGVKAIACYGAFPCTAHAEAVSDRGPSGEPEQYASRTASLIRAFKSGARLVK